MAKQRIGNQPPPVEDRAGEDGEDDEDSRTQDAMQIQQQQHGPCELEREAGDERKLGCGMP